MPVRGNGLKAGNPFLLTHDRDAGRGPAVLVAMESRTVERGVVARSVIDRKTEPEAWQRRRARALTRRIAETGMNLRIRRAEHLCAASGALFAEVDPRGTTRECSACGADVPKGLGERVHRCPACGFTADRDFNASVKILGRALREFRLTDDPGGRIAAAVAEQNEAAAKRERKRASRVKGGRARLGFKRGCSDSRIKHQGGVLCGISN